jgi:hypothetical protein
MIKSIFLITILITITKADQAPLTDKTWKVDSGNVKLNYDFTSKSISVEVEADYQKMSRSLAIQWRLTNANDCPSFVLWWDKSNEDSPSLSVTAGCKKAEAEPIMRWELVNDWDRDYDKVETDGGVKKFKFKGTRTFEQDIGDFGQSTGYKNVRIITDNGQRIDWDHGV